MKIEEAIKKAIGMGYSNYPSDAFLNEHWICMSDTACQIFLDPSFWQSLGEALGWGKPKPCPGCDGGKKIFPAFHDPITHVNYPTKCGICRGEQYEEINDYKHYWHAFIDNLADGKTAEKFFADL